GKGGGKRKLLLPAYGENVRRRRVLLRAVQKVACCCHAAGVRTAPTLAKTLKFFDFGSAEDGRYKAGRMRTVDVWHWLRLLTAPTDPSSFKGKRSTDGGKQQAEGAKGRRRGADLGDC
ncbi:unnamed protein product, partial [Pylaiella littoralis]